VNEKEPVIDEVIDVPPTPALDRLVDQIKEQFWPWLLRHDIDQPVSSVENHRYKIQLDEYVYEVIHRLSRADALAVLSELYDVHDPVGFISPAGHSDSSKIFGASEAPSAYLKDFLIHVVLTRLTCSDAEGYPPDKDDANEHDTGPASR
jgi:hypothetical protein